MRNVPKLIREHVKCCHCGGPLKEFVMVSLLKLATWKRPVSGNIFKPDDPKFAVSILCKSCVVNGEYPKSAVEFIGLDIEDADDSKIEVIYHPLEELDDFIVGG